MSDQHSTTKLDQLYFKANSFNEEIPSELAKKIVVYTEILRVLGTYISLASYKLGTIQTDRKREYALALVQEGGTQKEREGKAELRITKYRRLEYKAESELIKWKNAFISTQELINALKKQLEVLLLEWGGNGNGNG